MHAIMLLVVEPTMHVIRTSSGGHDRGLKVLLAQMSEHKHLPARWVRSERTSIQRRK